MQAATIRQLVPYINVIITVDVLNVNMKDEKSQHSLSRSGYEFAPKQFPHKFVQDATALHYACLTRNLNIITILIKAGADWTARDSQDRRPEDLLDNELDRDVKLALIELRGQEFDRLNFLADGT